MKKLITAILVSLSIAVVSASSVPAQAQGYCGSCCDRDPYGAARVRCSLVSAYPCGYACECFGIPGAGFACY